MEILFWPYRFWDHRSLWGRCQACWRERDAPRSRSRKDDHLHGSMPEPMRGFVHDSHICVHVSSGTVSPNRLSITGTDLISREDRCLGVPRIHNLCSVAWARYDLPRQIVSKTNRINIAVHRSDNDRYDRHKSKWLDID